MAFNEDLLNGVSVIKGVAKVGSEEIPIQLIPYNARNNREISPMAVLINEEI